MSELERGEASLTVDFEPVGRRASVGPGATILKAAQDVGIELVSLCGGVGACDSCKVRIAGGQIDQPTLVEQAIFSREEIAAGWRLGCRMQVGNRLGFYYRLWLCDRRWLGSSIQ